MASASVRKAPRRAFLDGGTRFTGILRGAGGPADLVQRPSKVAPCYVVRIDASGAIVASQPFQESGPPGGFPYRCTSSLAAFPDASIVCGALETAKGDANAIVNPTLLVGVTSRSTEDYDRGDKLSCYKQLPSLRAVLFVSHRERRVTVVHRTPRGWDETDRRGGEHVALEDPALSFTVDDL